MKFVHLTNQSSLTKIRSNGIRMSKGRLGRGVYAVPLFLCNLENTFIVEHSADPENDPLKVSILTSVPVSSATLWKWWVKTRKESSGNNKVAALIFRIPDSLWPIRVNIHIWQFLDLEVARKQRGEPQIEPILISLGLKPLDVMKGIARSYQVDVASEKDLGQLINKLLDASWRLLNEGPQDIEVAIPGPIPPNYIERIVPFYRTNKEFKKRRDKVF